MAKQIYGKEYVAGLLTNMASLNELLGIMSGICQHLDLNRLNNRHKQFASLQFIFFGLMAKSQGLFIRITFRMEHIATADNKISEKYHEISQISKTTDRAFALVRKNRLKEASKEIISIFEYYQEIYDELYKLLILLL